MGKTVVLLTGLCLLKALRVHTKSYFMPCGCGPGAWLCLPWEMGRRWLEMESEGTALETGLTALPPQSDEGAWGQAPGCPCPQLPPLATPWHRQRRHKAKAVLPEKKNSCPRQWLFLSILRMDIWTDVPTCAYTKLQQELGPAVTGCTGSARLWPDPHLW